MYFPIGSSRPTFFSSTSCRIEVTVKVLVSLPIRMCRSGDIFWPVLLSATPKDFTYSPLSGVHTPTVTPGTFASSMTFCTAVSSSFSTAGVSF